MQPDHLLSTIVGACIGSLFGLGFAAVALGKGGSARARIFAGLFGFALSVAGGIAGCVAGFQVLWDATGDVAWAGLGAGVGAVILAGVGGSAPFGAWAIFGRRT